MTSNWKFDEKVVPIFDDHVRKSVPMYDEIHRIVNDIAGWFLEDGTNVYDIGTSTGEVISNLLNKYPTKYLTYLGFDTSIDMVHKAKERFETPNVSILKSDVTSSDVIVENASLITSILTVQFIPQRKRQELINKLYNGLNKGGAFIIVEKVIGSNARFNEMWIELYHELKLRNGLSEEEVFNKSRSIRGVMRPYTVNENVDMLIQAGFKDVDMFFKWNNFAGFVAIK